MSGDTQTASWREDGICPYKEARLLPSGRNKDAISDDKHEPCLIFTVIPPILLEHIGEKVGLEKGIAATP